MLEMLGIPYSVPTHSVWPSAWTNRSPRNVQLAGIPTPAWRAVASATEMKKYRGKSSLSAFVKPSFEGSSKGIRLRSRVENKEQLVEVAASILSGYGRR